MSSPISSHPISPLSRPAQLQKIHKEALDLFTKKNADYGDSFAKHGSVGVLVRLGDKLSRLQSVSSKQVSLVNTESVRDTLIDLHNYAAMAIMLLDEDQDEDQDEYQDSTKLIRTNSNPPLSPKIVPKPMYRNVPTRRFNNNPVASTTASTTDTNELQCSQLAWHFMKNNNQSKKKLIPSQTTSSQKEVSKSNMAHCFTNRSKSSNYIMDTEPAHKERP